MRTNLMSVVYVALITLAFGTSCACSSTWSDETTVAPESPLTDVGRRLEKRYADQLERLRIELVSKLPKSGQANANVVSEFLANDALDAKFAKYVVLFEATPQGLAEFAQQGQAEETLVEKMLGSTELMKQMLVADGANAKKKGRSFGPPQYGQAVRIYSNIRKTSKAAGTGVLQRLALAISLEHAVPINQSNPVSSSDAPDTVDPVKRYLHYEKAYQDGELDAAFDQLSTWELRMVVNGDEPDETLAWGRKMLRNYRPDHIYNSNYGWRYVSIVGSDVKYGSGDVKHDRPDLQKYQNILMNGGVCGRRAFFGRFILRAFGIPTTARPSRGHAALAHWTPNGWVVNLGGGWGAGWTKTKYNKDVDFLASTQARSNRTAYLQVKRAQWAGDVLGEKRAYGENEKEKPQFWNNVSLRTQRAIIKKAKTVTLDALGEDLGEANEPTVAEKVMASPVKPKDKEISVGADGVISIPAAAYSKPNGNTKEVTAMKSFGGGLQIFLPRFFPQGKTIMRGGTWKGDPDACTSGKRMLSGGYGKYENWGLRVAVSLNGAPSKNLKLDLGGGMTMDLVYIKPGSFLMGGESSKDGRFECVELPKHEVRLTKGFYLGKYEVTQAQYETIMGSNPSKSTRNPDCPVDNVGEPDAKTFCGKLAESTGLDVRLPTEAEWEYASRAGRDAKWFFGDDPSQIGQYAWFKENAGGKSHPVGQKKPNPWGLYDIYGNVNERISDTYSRSYYSQSPKDDPTGPSQGTKSRLEYNVNVPQPGKYLLSAKVVTANENQRLNVAVNGTDAIIKMPFTVGDWQDSKPVTISLKKGGNTLQFLRNKPPQYGLAIKSFTLTPLKANENH